MDNYFISIKECNNFYNVFPFFKRYLSLKYFRCKMEFDTSKESCNSFMFRNIREIKEMFLWLVENREKNKEWTKIYILFKRHIYTIALSTELDQTITLFFNEQFYFDRREGYFTKLKKKGIRFDCEINDENKYEVFYRMIKEIKKNLF